MNTVDAIKDVNQIRHIKEYLQSRSPRDYCLFLIGINSGIRINELLSLHVKDVMTEEKEIRSFLNSTIYVNPPVFLSTPVRDSIKECITSESLHYHDYLFKSRKTNMPISRQQAYRIINEAGKHAGMEGAIGTHTLRKTFGYHAYRKGIAVSLIQKRLQQSAPSETIQYIGLSEERRSLPIILDVNL